MPATPPAIEPARTLATFFGSGLVPKAPGTAATVLAALPLLVIPEGAYAPAVAALAVLAFAGSVWASRRLLGRKAAEEDPGWFVLDEACGLWIAAWRPGAIAPLSLLFAVAMFRLLDIVKPYPIGKLERIGGCGIVLDDAAAGAVALIAGLLLEPMLGR
jgi:phosphatidylglycerophosphatase A